MKEIFSSKLVLVLIVLMSLSWITLGIVYFTDFWLEWLPSQPKKHPLELDHQISLPPKVNQDNAILENLTREYLQDYKIKGTDGKIRIFDLREEERYLASHIKHSSLTEVTQLFNLAETGRFAGKTLVILANTGETDELKELVMKLKEDQVGKVYLEPNFNPNNISRELVEEVLALPPLPQSL